MTLGTQKCIITLGTQKEVSLIKKKIGRPTDKLKDVDIKVRIDSDTNNLLQKYASDNGITRAESIRIAIKRLLGK